MKPLPLLLALSVVANVWLAVAAWRGETQRTNPVKAAPAVKAEEPPEAEAAVPVRPDATAEVPDYVAQMRAYGFPPNLIRALVLARVQEKYADRLKSVRAPRPLAYWRSTVEHLNTMTPDERTAWRAVNREMMDEARQLLSDEELIDPWEKANRAQSMGNLSAEKMQRVDAINRDYAELESQFRERTSGLILRSDREQYRLLEREKRADLAAVLTPDEFLEYDLRGSRSANSVQTRLMYFDPTEEEYRAIAKLQVEFDQQYGTQYLSADEQQRRTAAEKELPEKIRALLTPERFADFQITTDGSFRSTYSFLRSAGFEIDTVKSVVALQRDITQRADAIKAQPDLLPTQRAAALETLVVEATNQLTAKLGEKTFAEYQRGRAGWLNRLRPLAVKPKAP